MGRPKGSKNKKNIYPIYLCKLLGCFEEEYKNQYCKKHYEAKNENSNLC